MVKTIKKVKAKKKLMKFNIWLHLSKSFNDG
jgi:hypothetical protein